MNTNSKTTKLLQILLVSKEARFQTYVGYRADWCRVQPFHIGSATLVQVPPYSLQLGSHSAAPEPLHHMARVPNAL
eukprot:4736298-Amphidinium_carterae.1